MTGARDRYEMSAKVEATLTVQMMRARLHNQHAIERDVLSAVSRVRKTAEPGTFARAVLDVAEEEGLTERVFW